MYFIRTEEPIGGIARICFTHRMPNMLTDNDMKGGILVDPFEIEEIEGKIATACYDVEAKKVVIKYEEKPKTTEQQTREDISNIYYTLMNGGLI